MKFQIVSPLSNQGYPGILLKDIEAEDLSEAVLKALEYWKKTYSTETLFFSGDQLLIQESLKKQEVGIADFQGNIIGERDWRSNS